MCYCCLTLTVHPLEYPNCSFPFFSPLRTSLWIDQRYQRCVFRQGASGASVVSLRVFLENCVYHPFAESFCSQPLLQCPRMESSSVLKRSSDSDSALFSVTPRDRSVYASGGVRSTASNNAPCADKVRETHIHTHPTRVCAVSKMQKFTCTGSCTKLKDR